MLHSDVHPAAQALNREAPAANMGAPPAATTVVEAGDIADPDATPTTVRREGGVTNDN